MTAIADRIENERARIRRAAEVAGRNPGDVKLLAVSKTMPVSAILDAYAAGQRDFGENYVQELTEKADQLRHISNIRWHMIGHLQSNKAKYVTRVAHVVHSVGSLRLADELERRRVTHGPDGASPSARLPVLVEVNVGGESQKSGTTPDELPGLLDRIEGCAHLELRGLMTIPPFGEAAEASRPYFEALAELRARWGGRERLPELSMGMSQDLEVAIACGATWVRVGTAIFGRRETKG